jgi:hypothetical protein
MIRISTLPKDSTFLEIHAHKSSTGETGGICDETDHVIALAEHDLADDQKPDQDLEKADERGKVLEITRDENDPDGAQAHIQNPCEENQDRKYTPCINIRTPQG